MEELYTLYIDQS